MIKLFRPEGPNIAGSWLGLKLGSCRIQDLGRIQPTGRRFRARFGQARCGPKVFGSGWGLGFRVYVLMSLKAGL